MKYADKNAAMSGAGTRSCPYADDAPDAEAVSAWLHALQQQLCEDLEEADGAARFTEDQWQHEHGGGGRTCVISDGALLEKAGVNYSDIHGVALPAAATTMRPQLAGCAFHAMGVSAVLHPRNPFVPSAHLNVRFLSVAGDQGGGGKADAHDNHDTHGDVQQNKSGATWWFGGGFDLTPYYGFTEDAQHWHRNARDACTAFGAHRYAELKQRCDHYFYLPHRGEARGIGGLFFDDLNADGFVQSFALCRSVGEHFLPGWLPIATLRKDTVYGARQRAFQLYRRGRYVEFNLVYDRGTLFGLQSGGRVESILMSLPPKVAWSYNWRPPHGSDEEKLYKYFLQPRDWLDN